MCAHAGVLPLVVSLTHILAMCNSDHSNADGNHIFAAN